MTDQGIKRVLIITRDFAPYSPNPGWMIRTVTMANFFAQNGIETHVIATRRAQSWKLLEVDDRVHLHWVRGLAEYMSVKPESIASFPIYLATKALRGFCRRYGPSWFIDPSSLDVRAYLAKAEAVCSFPGQTNVIVSTPPHGLQVVGLKLKQKFQSKVKYIVDFRDGWMIRSIYRTRSATKTKYRVKLENAVLRAADAVCFVSSGMLEEYSRVLDVQSKSLVVENGFDKVPEVKPTEALMQRIARAHASGKVVVGYFGSGSVGARDAPKDLLPIIEALQTDEDLANRVLLVLFGSIRWGVNQVSIEIYSHGGVTNAQARANMRAIDVGLVQHSDRNDAPSVMGGKIYDYVASGIPLWFAVPEEAVSILRFVERTGKPFFANIFDPEQICSVLREILQERDSGRLRERRFSSEEASVYSREGQYNKILDLLYTDYV